MQIALIGYGKMGKAIEAVAKQKGHEIVLAVGSRDLDKLTKAALGRADVAIEFTGPSGAVSNLEKCFAAGVPVVCGSTGWLAHLEAVKANCVATDGGFLYASNFSVGVNIFFEVNRKLASLMKSFPEYDPVIKEIHHTAKKDAPSGTAITLAQGILENSISKMNWVNQPSDRMADLVITSERTDPAPGTHVVTYRSAVDDIEITHTAHNRQGFAAGAVLAAEFLMGKRGIYSMKNVLGI